MRTLTLWMGNGRRPASVAPATVEIALDDRVIGSAVVGDDLAAYSFQLPADLIAAAASRDIPPRIRLRVPTWTPRQVLGTPDDRDLGVMISRIEVR